METQIIQLVKDISWPGAVAVVALAMRPFIPIFLSKFNTKNGENKSGATVAKQVAELQQFKVKAETNHFTDLERLLNDNEKIWTTISDLQKEVSRNSQDIAYIRGKIGNGNN